MGDGRLNPIIKHPKIDKALIVLKIIMGVSLLTSAILSLIVIKEDKR